MNLCEYYNNTLKKVGTQFSRTYNSKLSIIQCQKISLEIRIVLDKNGKFKLGNWKLLGNATLSKKGIYVYSYCFR